MSFPFHCIVVPVDFDDSAGPALDLAKGLAAVADATVHLMHVMAILLTPGEAPSIVVAREEEVKAALEKIGKEQLGAARYQVHIRTGDTARGIVEVAQALSADLIVMPTHGRRGLPHLFLGSVAERVVREAPCPVLTVRPAAAVAEAGCSVAKVMITNPPSVGPSHTLADVYAIMQRENLLSIPVVADGVLTGIITDRDVRSQGGHLEDTRVQAVMARGPVTIAPTMPVEEAAHLLVKLGVGALPVVHNGKLVGLLSTREVIQTLLERSTKE